NAPAQFIYMYQGVCNSGTTATINGQTVTINAGCGPGGSGGVAYSGQNSQMIPMYPTSGKDNYENGYKGTNTGFSKENSAAAFLNTGVNFLNYFNIVYDPINGFIGYVPNNNASAPSGLVSVTPVLALQGTQQPIPAGTIVPWPVYLFTSNGGQQTSQV